MLLYSAFAPRTKFKVCPERAVCFLAHFLELFLNWSFLSERVGTKTLGTSREVKIS